MDKAAPAPKPHLSLQIQVDPLAGRLPVDRPQLRRWVVSALASDAQLVLRFVGAAEGRSLNQRFRGRNRPTNVLTFDYESDPLIRADIVLCMPVVREEARSQGKTQRDHLAHLVVHGVLHAQGHDHDNEADANRMEARETAILRRFGIDDPYA